MTSQVGVLLKRSPLPLLVSAPVLAALVGRMWLPSGGVWWWVAAVLGVLVLSLELSRQIRDGSAARFTWTREVTLAAQRLAASERRRALVEQQAERRTGAVSPETSRAFRLFTQLVRAEEATRAQMAAELHDAVAQTLSRALVELRAQQPDAALSSLVDAEEQLRAVMARIRPPELADGDLAGAVADLTSDLRSRYDVEVAVTWPDESFPMPAVLATTLYRFVQEALTNAVVHADGVDVRLHVAVVGPELHAEVSDGGPGFDPAQVTSSEGRHVGLQLVRERARLAGGVVELASTPGVGTTLRLRLPLQADEGRALGLMEQSGVGT